MAKGIFTKTITSSSNATTDIATPDTAPGESVYVMYVGVDVSVVGTTSTAKFGDAAGTVVAALFTTVGLGHQGENFATTRKDYPGVKLTEGSKFQLVTAGAAAATLTATVTYEVK